MAWTESDSGWAHVTCCFDGGKEILDSVKCGRFLEGQSKFFKKDSAPCSKLDNCKILKVQAIICQYCQFQWPLRLRRGSAALHLLGKRLRIPPGHGYLSVVSVVGCQLQVSALGWSLVQRIPTECLCLSVILKRHTGDLGPWEMYSYISIMSGPLLYIICASQFSERLSNMSCCKSC
jgi:hypothetical protein